jgi:hypothetical protein
MDAEGVDPMVTRLLIILLAGINLALLAALLWINPGPSIAIAQPVPMAGNYVMVTGKIQDDYDAIYLMDLSSRTLHGFTLKVTTPHKLEYHGYRSLLADFRRLPGG